MLRLLLLSVPFFFLCLHQALTHRARVASGKSDAVCFFFSSSFFKVLILFLSEQQDWKEGRSEFCRAPGRFGVLT